MSRKQSWVEVEADQAGNSRQGKGRPEKIKFSLNFAINYYHHQLYHHQLLSNIVIIYYPAGNIWRGKGRPEMFIIVIKCYRGL